MDLNQIMTLIQAVSDSNLTRFFLEEGNIKLKLEKTPKCTVVEPEEISLFSGKESEEEKEQKEEVISPVLKGEMVKSPLVGTFYMASSPEAEPYVKVGESVKKGQVLGIIEAMKLMNEIEAERDGVIEAVLVENGQLVEYGQPLFSMI